MKSTLVCVVLASLTACVSASEVVPVGNGRYMITGRASGGSNAGKETTEATEAADAFCDRQSKQMVLQ